VSALQVQYLLFFVMVGSLLPFQPVFLRARGLDHYQIGVIQAVSSLAVFLTPVVATLLADTHLKPRRLLLLTSLLNAAFLAALLNSQTFWPLLIAWCAYSLSSAPQSSLHDGLYFTLQKREQASGRRVAPYHRVRVWGTVGFILPSLALFWLLGHERVGIEVTVTAAIVGAMLCVFNALMLPDTPVSDEGGAGLSRLPTAAAARALLQPQALVFCAAMFLISLSLGAFYTFHPLYLADLGIASRWIGLIVNIGVAVEVVFMLGFGGLLGRLGLRRLMVIGSLCTAARMFILALFPVVPVAVASQLLHGLMVVTVHVAGPIYLNSLAQDRYRNSIQGLYAMAIFGIGRLVGNLLAGEVAAWGLSAVFHVAGGLCVVATLLFAVAFFPKPAATPEAAAV
jgi:PPP family 3-phenylpropionic acid transporter